MAEISDRAQGYIVADDVLMALAFVIVSLRFYCKIQMGSRRGLWWDDLFAMLALLFAVGFGACVNISMAHYGWDRHIWEIDPFVLSNSVTAFMVSKILFIGAGTSVRMALLAFYLWLIKDLRDKPLSLTIYGCMAFNVVVGLSGIFLAIFHCLPISTSCIAEGLSTTVHGALLSLADLIVNILPLPIVARLQVPVKQRVAATVLLSIGTVATAAGVVREVYIYRALVSTHDTTWEALPLWICADVEIYLGLFCACVPPLRPLWHEIHALYTRTLIFIGCSDQDQGDLHVPPTTTWEKFDKDVIFDGTSTFHSATNVFCERKKSYTATVLNQVDSFFSRRRETKDYTEMEDLQHWPTTPVEPQEVHVRTSARSQNV